MSNSHYQNISPSANTSIAAGGTDNGCALGMGQDTDGDGVEGEDQEEPASSNEEEDGHGGTGPEDALAIFRDQWQLELVTHPQQKHDDPPAGYKQVEDDEESLLDKAKSLFLQGVENEQNRKFYEAIQCYRRAVQLVPDIEFQLDDVSKPKMRERQDDTDTKEELEINLEQGSDYDCDSSSDEEQKDGSLLTRLLRIFSRSRCICVPQIEQKTTHISALPFEILLYILRWVVSSELDVRSLEQCAGVCRGFYLGSRDEEIWRLACIRVWGLHCGGLTNYESWRQMFIYRPHLQFNGCYISKTTYVRPGENSFCDQFYRSWHLVEYYRYLRFFPDGLVLMLTTPDEPVTSLQQLRYRTPRNSTVLSGHYRLHDDCVVIVLQRQNLSSNNRYRARRRDAAPELTEQTFNIEVKIVNHRNRMNVQLVWQFYSVHVQYRNGQGSSTNFDLPASRYPPFWFSRVKSYSAVSESLLQ